MQPYIKICQSILQKCKHCKKKLKQIVKNHHQQHQIKKKIKLIETQKGNIQANIERTKEIPTLIKGSKKKQS